MLKRPLLIFPLSSVWFMLSERVPDHVLSRESNYQALVHWRRLHRNVDPYWNLISRSLGYQGTLTAHRTRGTRWLWHVNDEDSAKMSQPLSSATNLGVTFAHSWLMTEKPALKILCLISIVYQSSTISSPLISSDPPFDLQSHVRTRNHCWSPLEQLSIWFVSSTDV